MGYHDNYSVNSLFNPNELLCTLSVFCPLMLRPYHFYVVYFTGLSWLHSKGCSLLTAHCSLFRGKLEQGGINTGPDIRPLSFPASGTVVYLCGFRSDIKLRPDIQLYWFPRTAGYLDQISGRFLAAVKRIKVLGIFYGCKLITSI